MSASAKKMNAQLVWCELYAIKNSKRKRKKLVLSLCVVNVESVFKHIIKNLPLLPGHRAKDCLRVNPLSASAQNNNCMIWRTDQK